MNVGGSFIFIFILSLSGTAWFTRLFLEDWDCFFFVRLELEEGFVTVFCVLATAFFDWEEETETEFLSEEGEGTE